jgi:malonyl-CoA decarboxylase
LTLSVGVNREDATQKVYAYIKSAESEHSEQLEKELREELEPKYNRFFDRIQQLPNGLKILTDMRADLLVNKKGDWLDCKLILFFLEYDDGQTAK